MANFGAARGEAFSAISEIETVEVMDRKEKLQLKIKDEFEVWKVTTEILGKDGNVIVITLHLSLPEDFPYSLPEVYLSPKDCKALKYLPHIDTKRLICTFDMELTRPDISNPVGVIMECIRKAKQIVREGLHGSNFDDFEDEFLAYWGCNYSENDKFRNDVLCLINPDQIPSTPTLLKIAANLGAYNYVIHNTGVAADNFKNFLSDNKLRYTESACFYGGSITIDFTPPFDYTNSKIFTLLEQLTAGKKEQFEQFINNKVLPKFVLVTINTNGKNVLVGWFHKPVILVRNGFRPGYPKPMQILTTFQKTDRIIRVTPEIFTSDRFSKRTEGVSPVKEFKFVMAGLGSVGSNLMELLNAMNFPEFRMIDYDKFKVENTGRHLLGYNYLGMFKTKALKDFLSLKNPTQTILTRESSIIKVANTEIAFINDADYIFMATGKTNVENWIGDAIENGMITKPAFFIWVEPYLAGGHCIYVVPGSFAYKSFFSAGSMYRHNVISEAYYTNPINSVALKEAGCQTTFTPYSGSNLIIFLGSLFPVLFSIIQNAEKVSRAFTWIGNIGELIRQGVDLSEYAKDKAMGNIVEH